LSENRLKTAKKNSKVFFKSGAWEQKTPVFIGLLRNIFFQISAFWLHCGILSSFTCVLFKKIQTEKHKSPER